MKSVRLSLFAACLAVRAAFAASSTFTENFTANPSSNGWQVYGNTSLFQWDSTNGAMNVTWDSSQPNSYFYHPLNNIVAISDDFTLEFDLTLQDAAAEGFFQLAVGLFNFDEATNAAFSRAQAASPDLFEFDYYPDGGFGPSIDATLSDQTVNATNTSDFYFAFDNVPLNPGTPYHILIHHAAGDQFVTGEVLTNGQVYTPLPFSFAGPITDFRINTVSISSYTSTDDPYGDSVLAHGMVDNITVTLPPPPVQKLEGLFNHGGWQARFISRDSSWNYTLQRTVDFHSWTNVSITSPGNSGTLTLQDTNAPAGQAFYRVQATRP